MKPREFDDLVRQKFEQNDFEYSPKNWDKLSEQLDGRAKKRGLLVWWMPLVGVAASVALAMGVTVVMRSGNDLKSGSAEFVAKSQTVKNLDKVNTGVENNVLTSVSIDNATISKKGGVSRSTRITNLNTAQSNEQVQLLVNNSATKTNETTSFSSEEKTSEESYAVKPTLNNTPRTVKSVHVNIDLLADNTELAKKEKAKKKVLLNNDKAMYTFNEENRVANHSKTSIILSGGLNFGNRSNGYSIGASARRMVNDKVYVEGDVAFMGSSNTQEVLYSEKVSSASLAKTNSYGGMIAARTGDVNAKNSGESAPKSTDNPGMTEVIKSNNVSYNLYYAQVTPSIGYKIMKRFSLGVGPDFQKMLVDNRPAPSTVDKGNLREMPTFDIGLVGKTEVAVTNNIKAAVYYRNGINNVITPMNKFIDRNYVQVQVKCTIFNK